MLDLNVRIECYNCMLDLDVLIGCPNWMLEVDVIKSHRVKSYMFKLNNLYLLVIIIWI